MADLSEDIKTFLRYGMGKDAYDAKAAAMPIPPALEALAAGNPNVKDRYLGQAIAAENSPFPDALVRFANEFAPGDALLKGEPGLAERTKDAGRLGYQAGLEARAPAAFVPPGQPEPEGIAGLLMRLFKQGGR